MKIDDSFPHDLYLFLPKRVRDEDQKVGRPLERFLQGPQLAWEGITDDILRLDTLHSVDEIDDDWLTLLKWTVGWTPELDDITSSLDAVTLRKLITLSVKLWKLKGTELGTRDAIRLLTGRDVIVRNWFSLRWTVDVTGLWQLGVESDPWLVGDEFGDRDEYLTLLLVHNEVGIDRALIRRLVNLGRPLQEVVRIVYCTLVDDFRLGRQKWVTDTLPDVTWDDTRYRLILEPGTVIRANVPALATAEEVVWRQRVAFTGASGGACQLEFRRDSAAPNNRYRATWEQDGTVSLEIVVGGIATVLDSAALGHSIPQDETAVIGVDVARENVGRLRLTVRVYEAPVIDLVVEEPDLLDPGEWRFANSSAGDVEIDDVIAHALPVTVDEVGPSGETVGDPDELVDSQLVINVLTSSFSTLTGLWHVSDWRYISGTDALYYGTGEVGYYTWGTPGSLGGVITSGFATSDPIDLSMYPAGEYAVFILWWQVAEIRGPAGVDQCVVQILVGGVVVATLAKAATVGTGVGVITVGPEFKLLDISSFVAGEADVQIRFGFNSVTAPTAGTDGWIVDGVRLLIRKV